MSRTIFLLSPAWCGGVRGGHLLRADAPFELAVRLRETGITLGEAFSFVSGLYFRGKLAYATAFGESSGPSGVLVIAPGRGLVSPGLTITVDDLRRLAAVGVDPDEPQFQEPLDRDAQLLADELGPADRAVLLGSIATDKYTGILRQHLQGRLQFPADFVGRGDMSRGGLLLRCVREERELVYIPLDGATRRGPRPPRLSRQPPG